MTTLTDYLTRQEAAQYLGLSYPTLSHWAIRGEGPACHKFGNTCFYERKDVERFKATYVRPKGGRGAANA